MKPELVTPDLKRWDPGEAIGRYRLLTRIAIGGMAEIWLANQTGVEGFEKVVVIKRISDAFSADHMFVEMFLDEARIAAQLNHPNIVQIHDLGEHRGAYYIAMEYLHGEDLAMVVRTGAKTGERLPFTHAAQIISLAAEGLASAHEKVGLDGKPLKVVHRDVSPQNIFVTYEGVVKMLDFGVAKAATRASHTHGGQLKGKFGYMSPEQARGDDIDARADVWSLGVVLFEAATLTRLWDPKQDPQRTLKELTSEDKVVSARERSSEVPPELEEIIAKALERDPYRRFQSANDMKHALDRWLRAQGKDTSSHELSGYMRQLFAERMGRKSALIESARSGEIKFFKAPEALQADEASMPGETVVSSGARQIPRPKRKVALMAGLGTLAALIVLAGIGLAQTLYEPPVLEVDTVPTGARLEIDGSEAGTAPYKSDRLREGKHVVMAFIDGRADQAKTVTLVDGHATQVLIRFPELVPTPPSPKEKEKEKEKDKEKEKSPKVADASPPPSSPDAPKEKEKPPPAPPREKPPPPPPPAAKGSISVETNPWTIVFEGNKRLGETPLIAFPLPAGKHKLRLVNEEKNISKTIEVNVAPGKTTVTRMDVK